MHTSYEIRLVDISFTTEAVNEDGHAPSDEVERRAVTGT